MHFTCSIEKPEGVYQIRLYDMAIPSSGRVSMEFHSKFLFDPFTGKSNGKVISGDLVFDDGFGDVQSSFENELFQNSIEHQNFKLSLDADPILSELVASWRNLRNDIWLEVVLEQRVNNLPSLQPFILVQPRQTRLIWWGKLIRNEATGYVDYQSFKADKGLIRNPIRRLHIGGLEMTFVHWLHAAFSNSAYNFLLDFRIPYTLIRPICSSFELLYELVKYISPTSLCSVSDSSFTDWQAVPTDANGYSISFNLDYSLTSVFPPGATIEAHSLHYIGLIVVTTNSTGSPIYTPYFLAKSDTADNNAGENSLFTRWNTLGDAMATLCREFFLKFDVELPTLSEVWAVRKKKFGRANKKKDIETYWPSVSRWAFGSIDEFTIEVVTTPLEKSIKYNPAAVWIKTITVDVPTPSDFVSTPASLSLPYGEGKELNYKTLFRFLGTNKDGNPANRFRRIELFIWNTSEPKLGWYANHVSFSRDNVTQDFTEWNAFHVYKNWDVWGGTRAVIEFDAEETGITTYPSEARSFGLLDWGDFANLRYFDASPGLLYHGSEFGRFSVIEISRKPGSFVKHIRGIERQVLTPDVPPMIIIQPPEDTGDPPNILPPNINPFEPICGIITFVFGVVYDGCVDHIDATLDGLKYQTIPGWNRSGHIVASPLFVDTTTLPNGPHTICITIYPCNGSAPVTVCWSFTVTNPCTGGGQHTFMYDPP